jgi:hypothetical protein
MFKYSVIFLVLSIIGSSICVQRPVLRYLFTYRGKSLNKQYYFAPNIKVNWVEAIQICREYGMELARFETENEQQTFLRHLGYKYPNKKFFMAGTDSGIEGFWRWAPKDTPISMKLEWGPRQPDNGGGRMFIGENCLLAMRFRNGFKLNDEQCDAQHNFICQQPTIFVN